MRVALSVEAAMPLRNEPFTIRYDLSFQRRGISCRVYLGKLVGVMIFSIYSRVVLSRATSGSLDGRGYVRMSFTMRFFFCSYGGHAMYGVCDGHSNDSKINGAVLLWLAGWSPHMCSLVGIIALGIY
jgi:hypothetical protein